MRKILEMTGISFGLALIVLGVIYFAEIKESFTQTDEIQKQSASDFGRAKQLVELDRPLEAYSLIKKHKNLLETHSQEGGEWMQLLLETAAKIPDTEQLLYIYSSNPQSFKNNEKASLIVASALLASQDTHNYENIRAYHRGREADPDGWFLLDADYLIQQGKITQAMDFLKSRYFEGKQDTPRLLRLALLNINDHPKIAWDYLNQASKKDSLQPDLKLFKGELLETAGKKELAQVEYINADAASFGSMYVKEHLFDFYLRTNDIAKAEETFSQMNKQKMSPDLIAKAIFFSKTIRPLSYDFKTLPLVKGDDRNDLNYLISLKEEEFWNPNGAKNLSKNDRALWLQVLNNMKQGRTDDALILLAQFENEPTPFMKELTAALKNPQNVKEPIRVLLKNGWNEAVLKLDNGEHLDVPTSLLYAKALQRNRGIKEAIQYLGSLPSHPEYKMMLAELFVENKNFDAALAELKPLLSLDSDAGVKGAWFYSLLAYQQGDAAEAKTQISKHAALLENVQAREMLAYIALQEGKKDEARSHYQAIADKSIEAKSYLAKALFDEKNYTEALHLTDEILKVNPDNKVIWENRNKIIKALGR